MDANLGVVDAAAVGPTGDRGMGIGRNEIESRGGIRIGRRVTWRGTQVADEREACEEADFEESHRVVHS